jgi:predicted transcriptional regulator
MIKKKKLTEVVTLRIGSDVKLKLEEIAAKESRTLAGQIRAALGEWFDIDDESRAISVMRRGIIGGEQ